MSDRCATQGSPETIRSFDEAALAQRCQLERQLHDGPALRLAALSLQLGLCRYQITDSDHALRERLDEIQAELHTVLQELRTVAGQIYPPVLEAAGLGAALEAMVEQLGLPITMRGPDERYSSTVEAAAYFAVAERLRSIEGRSSTVTVTIRSAEDDLLLSISTDGDAADEVAPVVMRIACA
jgi:signal transduction histidine kinase